MRDRERRPAQVQVEVMKAGYGRRASLVRLVLLAVAPLVLVVGLAIPGVASAESLCTDTWVGPTEGNWGINANWSTGKEPTSSEVACIGSGKTVTITEANHATGVLQGEGALVMTGGTLEVISALESSRIKTLNIVGGTFIGAAEVKVVGSFSAGGFQPSMMGSGKIVIETGASGSINNGPDVVLAKRTIENNGSLTIQLSAGIDGKEGAAIINNGTLTVNGEKESSNGLFVETGGATLTNKGTVQKTEGAGVTHIAFTVDNESTVTAKTGTLSFSGGGTSSKETVGSWSASSGAQIIFIGSTFTLGTTVPMSGKVVVTEKATVTAGTIEGTALNLKTENVGCCTYGTLELAGTTPSTIQTLTVEGDLIGKAEIDVTSSFTGIGISGGGGQIEGAGKLVIEPGASGSISGNGPLLKVYKGWTLINDGSLTMPLDTGIDAREGVALVNHGTLTVNGERSTTSGLRTETPGPKPRLVNTGKVQKTEGTGITPIEFAFENFGTIEERTGKFEITEPIIVVPAESQYGATNASALEVWRSFCGKPVNCVTGNETESQTDLSVAGRGLGLKLTRTYNAQEAAKASSPRTFGYGWSGPFSDHIVVESASHTATVYQANGSTVTFTESGGTFTAPSWSGDTLNGSTTSGYTLTLANQTKYAFNGSNGRLESVEDRNGNKTTLGYNEKGQLSTITDPAGRKITLAYNTEGLVESATDPMGHVVKYTYESGNLASVTLPGETSPNWRFKYDTSHRVTAMIDGRGGETTNTYDGSNRVTAQKDPLGHVTKFEYEPFQTKITNEATGAVTLEQFSSSDTILSITHGYGTSAATTETFTYNERDERTSKKDGNGHTTTYEYDSTGNKIKQVDPEARETKWTYSSTHDILSETKPNGEKTTITRDEHGNPTVISRPAPGNTTQETKLEYNPHGQPTSMTDPLGHKWAYEYDNQGDRTSETDPEGDKRTWAYNEDSQETSTVSPRGNVTGGEPSKYTTTIERDAQSRPAKITDPLGHETHYAYDADGNLTGEVDPNGHETKTEYNADNEPIKVKEPNGTIRETGYDGAGAVTSQTDGNKHTTSYARNVLEQVTEVTDPLLRKTTKTYDAVGNLASVTDPAKRTTTYTYNKDNQPTKLTYSDGVTPTVEYEYDKDGNRTSMTDGTGKTTDVYDQLDRLTESKDGHGNVVKYEYDLAGEQTKITYPNGKTVEHGYDKASRLASVKDWLGNTTSFGYDPNSNPTTTTFPTGTSEIDRYAYNEADQQSEAKMSKGAEAVASLAYTRDKAGQLTKTIAKGLPGAETTEYAYDENERLSKAGTNAYEYDPADNPIKEGAIKNTFNAGNELTESKQLVEGVEVPFATYEYDSLGERTKTTPATGTATTYGYDQAGDLTSAERTLPAISDTYSYDGNGLRASQTISGTTSYLTWDMTERLPLILNDGTTSYVYGPGGLPIEQINNKEEPQYLHHDQPGSTRLLTGSTGTIEGAYTYTPYGAMEGHIGTATTPFSYDAQYTNADTGLLYLRARSYDPGTAQFMTVDPLVRRTRAPYVYANDNPLTFGDPTGRAFQICVGGTVSLGFFSVEANTCYVNTPGGEGVAVSGGASGGPGFGVNVHGGAGGSNAQTPEEYGGPFATAGGSAQLGFGGYAGGFVGQGGSCNLVVAGGTVGISAGIGAEAGAGVSYTEVFTF